MNAETPQQHPSSASPSREGGASDPQTLTQDQRAEERTEVCAECELRIFNGPDAEPTVVHGTTKNLSFRGVCVVSEVCNAVAPGKAVEIHAKFEGRRPEYLAGIIVFCRKIDTDHFQLGIQVEATGQAPILTHDIERARALYDWFDESLRKDEGNAGA